MFLNHESCPKCGSSDAKAVYDNGTGWCFSCHTYFPGEFRGTVVKKQQSLYFPTDLTTELSKECLDILNKYQLSKEGFFYSPSYNRVIYIWFDNGCPIGWEGRALSKTNPKWFKVGDTKNKILSSKNPIVTGTVVLVEDLFSALKLSVYIDVLLVGGTHLPTSVLASLGRLYDSLIVWFDGDTPGIKAAETVVSRARMLGMGAKHILIPGDPKDYTYPEIQHMLNVTNVSSTESIFYRNSYISLDS